MYKYETHLHTYPVSACAAADVRENLEFYKDAGYDILAITDHWSCSEAQDFEGMLILRGCEYHTA